MSWLTHAQLRRDTPAARQLANLLLKHNDRDRGHGLVWNLFADDPEATRDFLYREIEVGGYLLVSVRRPMAEPALWTLRSKPYAPALASGDRLGFSLRANPTISLSQPDRRPSRRVDVFLDAKKKLGRPLGPEEREAAALNWLFGRAASLGVDFERDACRTGRRDQQEIERPGARAARITIVDYQGILTVRDPALLSQALISGVGHGKAFGAGLLLLSGMNG